MNDGKGILRFVTMGSVDDGKSTLIGRLLYETNCVYIDQFEAARNTSIQKGMDDIDLALITDGLKSEREQGITIDVAYRYFSTQKRKFIVADGPGHTQYTRNSITGASHCDVSVILLDAKNGITEQSKRHAFISSLLRIGHVFVAVNKMDLVNFSEEEYKKITNEYSFFLDKLDIEDVTFCPVCALRGDNILNYSRNMSWYQGSTVLDYLENVYIKPSSNTIDFRFPVQLPLRPNSEFRGYAGEVVSGAVRTGDEIIVLPSKQKTRVSKIYKSGNIVDQVGHGCAVLVFDDEIDVGRGDVISRLNNRPIVSNSFEVMMCWLDNKTMDVSRSYFLKHNSKITRAFIKDIRYVIDINTLHKADKHPLKTNDIGRIHIETAENIAFDYYQVNKKTGSFILIDPDSYNTVAAGFIKFETRNNNDKKSITIEDREKKNGHTGQVLWLTGLSGSGKTTIAKELELRLFNSDKHVILLDGDEIRKGLCCDLGFSKEDRDENIRRVGEVTSMLCNQGMIVICTFVSPFRVQRDFVKDLVGHDRFLEIYVDCSKEECEKRDVKGLYKKFRNGEIPLFTGFTSPYEPPLNPNLILSTEKLTIDECVRKVMEMI